MPERTSLDQLERENAYLKLRLAQLVSDFVDLKAENDRLQDERERLHARRIGLAPNPLGGH